MNDKTLIMDNSATMLQTLHRIPWFNDLSAEALQRLARISAIRNLDAGDVLFCEGDAENCLYILISGEIDLETHAPGFGAVKIFVAEPLDLLGWSSLTPVVRQRTDTATARSDCTLVSINNDLLRQACEEDHETGFIIMRRIANVAASRLLTTRLHLFKVIQEQSDRIHQDLSPKQD